MIFNLLVSPRTMPGEQYWHFAHLLKTRTYSTALHSTAAQHSPHQPGSSSSYVILTHTYVCLGHFAERENSKC